MSARIVVEVQDQLTLESVSADPVGSLGLIAAAGELPPQTARPAERDAALHVTAP